MYFGAVERLLAQLGSMPDVEGGAEFEKLTCHHAIKLVTAVDCSVEEACLAVGEMVGCSSIKSDSGINWSYCDLFGQYRQSQ